MYKIWIFLMLFASWLVLSGKADAMHLSLGVLSSLLVMWMSSDMLFRDRGQGAGMRLRQVLLLPGYLLWLMGQVVSANWMVMRLALVPGGLRRVKPLVVTFESGLRTDFAKFALAQSITLTPGTVTIKITDQTFYVHAINPAAAEEVGQAMEARIARIFEPGEENAMGAGG